MPTRANPHRPIGAEKVYIYDDANQIDDRALFTTDTGAPWVFAELCHNSLLTRQKAGKISRKIKYANIMTVSGYQLRIKCEDRAHGRIWTVKARQIKKA